MIVPMIKYSFLIHCDDYGRFMSDLKDLGVLHIIEKTTEPTVGIIQKYKLMAEANKIIDKLRKIAQSNNSNNTTEDNPQTGDALFGVCTQLQAQSELLQRQLIDAERNRKLLLPWGVFSKGVLGEIENSGWKIHFYICPTHKYKPVWEEEFELFYISRLGNNAYFIVVDNGCFVAPAWDADEVVLPDVTLAEVELMILELTQKQDEIACRLASVAANKLPAIERYVFDIKEDIVLQAALANTQAEAGGMVMVLEGWVPETAKVQLDAFLVQNNSLYITDNIAATHEKPPIVLKNSRFSRLFELIGNIYSLPNYNELDLTRFVAPFYLLFFGFCFSDAGYGLLVVAAAAIAKHQTKISKPILSLAQLLGASTIVFGLLGGTFLGMDLYESDLPVYSSLSALLSRSHVKLQDIIFNAALVLGAMQILLGMFIKVAKIKKQSGFKYAVSSLCWVLLIIASGINYWLSSKHILVYWNVFYVVFGSLCCVGIFFYNMPDKGLLYNIGGGVWDAYNTIIGGIGDLLSEKTNSGNPAIKK
jgi:V/A-type H+-transporting ATPase subunit I